MNSDKDYFSKQSIDYARYRPRYPESLFSYLAGLVPTHDCAWDCATGNGQAAVGLAQFFEHVIATDISEAQLSGAFQHPRIQYKAAHAESSGLASESVELITVAQALHWFDIEGFYKDANRVLKPRGAIAVWTYNVIQFDEQTIDALVREFHDHTVGPFWPPERDLVMDGYRSLPFPFREINPPRIEMETRWDLAHLIGYLRSWSATQRYIDKHTDDPTSQLAERFGKVWGEAEKERIARWPLQLRVGFKA